MQVVFGMVIALCLYTFLSKSSQNFLLASLLPIYQTVLLLQIQLLWGIIFLVALGGGQKAPDRHADRQSVKTDMPELVQTPRQVNAKCDV